MRDTKARRYTENNVKEEMVERYLPEIKKEWKKHFNGAIRKEAGEKEAIKK